MRCKRCGEEKGEESFYGSKNRAGEVKLHASCKFCTNLAQKIQRRLAKGLPAYGPLPKRVIPEAIRKIISVKNKEFYAKHPEAHFWKGRGRVKSQPCEVFKEALRSQGIQFAAEFSPNVEGRHFSLDVAFPDQMVAVEINGTQHYDGSGKLKPYYQERHDVLERNGWKIFEIFYKVCYRPNQLADLIALVTSEDKIKPFDYGSYEPSPARKIKKCEACGKTIARQATRCATCDGKRRREASRIYDGELISSFVRRNGTVVFRAELELQLSSSNVSSVARLYGVSDPCVKKWCALFKIPLKKRKEKFCSCGKKILFSGPDRCRPCLDRRELPFTEEQVRAAMIDNSLRGAAQSLATSRPILRRLLKRYGLPIPSRNRTKSVEAG